MRKQLIEIVFAFFKERGFFSETQVVDEILAKVTCENCKHWDVMTGWQDIDGTVRRLCSHPDQVIESGVRPDFFCALFEEKEAQCPTD